MATVIRKRDNGILCSTSKPTLGAAFSDTTGTSITFAAALKLNDGSTNVPTLGTDEYRVLIVDPDTSSEEIMALTAYTAGATTGTVVRNYEGQGAKTHANGAPVAFGPVASDFGGILTVVDGSKTNTDYTTTSTTSVDIDATNLAPAFTAPLSGKVLVTMVGAQYNSGANTNYIQLRESTTVLQERISLQGNANNWTPLIVKFLVTGLTPGSSHTYKAGFRTSAGTMHVGNGDGTTGNAPPLIVTVEAVV